MKQVHFTLYGKGGSGKSLVATLVAQYLRNRGGDSPVSLEYAYPAPAYPEEGSNYDSLFKRVIEDDSDFVIDNPATSFFSLRHYIIDNDAINLVTNHGKQVVMHVVITSDPASHSNLINMLSQIPEQSRVIVWLNDIYEKIEGFEETQTYLDNKDRIHGIVRIARRTDETFGADMQKMLTGNLTFDEVKASPDYSIMAKQRLQMIKQSIYGQLESVV